MTPERNIETPRLTVRAWRRSDRDFTLDLWGDRETGRYMIDPARENMDEAYLKAVDAMEDSPDGYYLLAELKADGAPVGTCCAFPEDGNVDIGYCIAKEHRGEGLGTEMAAALIARIREKGGRSVTAEAADGNLASVALLRKLGFSPVRKTRFKKWGEELWFDAHVYQLDLE